MKKILSFLIPFAVVAVTAMILPVAIVALVGSFTELSHPEYVQKISGLDISGSTVVSEEDTRGGFHGDGELVVIFDCADDGCHAGCAVGAGVHFKNGTIIAEHPAGTPGMVIADA